MRRPQAKPHFPPLATGRAIDLMGKYVLIGLTYYDSRDRFIDRTQLHGRITAADDETGFEVHLEGRQKGETYWLPPDLEAFHVARPGGYRLESTGEVVTSPDLVSVWVVAEGSKPV